MLLRKDAIANLRKYIETDDQGSYRSGPFDVLFAESYLDNHRISENQSRVYRSQLHILNDSIWNLLSICHRLDWQLALWDAGELDDMSWLEYAPVDVRQFHVEMKSATDIAAELVAETNQKRGQTPRKFTTLYGEVGRHKNKLGERRHAIIDRCDWYPQLKDVRESIVHHGSKALVMATHGEINFQIVRGHQEMVVSRDVMRNERVCDFRKYSVAMFSNFVFMLDELAETTLPGLPTRFVDVGESRSYHSGWQTMLDWSSPLASIPFLDGPSNS